MKRFLVVFLVLAFLIIPISQADDTPMRKLTLEANVSGESSDELDVCIYADITYPNATTAFESLDLELTYSKDVLELIDSVKADGRLESQILDETFLLQEVTSESGRYGLHAATGSLGSTGTGLLVHLRFRIIGQGNYIFRLKREDSAGIYSLYDSSTKKSETYHLPRMDIQVEMPTDVYNSQLTDVIGNDDLKNSGNVQQPKENGFLRFLRSIFGASCFGGK